ncbi:MAG: hypothetical protein JWO67_5162, partial [Streptosporangiaceae bacterium]|nr:hypothetical protein [Streptosporangiaceae bacterium]
NNYLVSTTTGSTITFASTDPGTALDVVMFSTSAPLSWSIDSGARTGTITPAGGAIVQKYTLATGLANTTHTITLTTTNTAGAYMIAARVYGAAGLEVHNAAAFGAWASGPNGWTATSDPTALVSRVNALLTVSPDVVWCALGVNDVLNAVTPSTITAALASIRSTFSASDFILTAQYQPSGATAWATYVAALYDLADTLDVPLLDLYDRSGGYTTANANGLMGDTIHPNAAAQRSWGRAAALLAAG